MSFFVRSSAAFLLAAASFAMPVLSQTSTEQPIVAGTVSFGKRVPSLDELSEALKPSELQAMNIRVTGPIKKSVDMELIFPFGSAEISAQVKAQLSSVGQYLQVQGSKLGPGAFRIEGHTDAVGSVEFNQVLSDKRAQAVRDFLITEYKVDSRILSAEGVGSAKLKDGRNPASEVNRRVEFSVTIRE
jgi:outer membrane protein OmpA-like peptidoglycan-associated protein